MRWGFGRPVIDRMLRRGDLLRSGRGRYVLADVEPAREDAQQRWGVRRAEHLRRAAALAGTNRVIGQRSAALARNLPVAEFPPRPELVRPPGSRQIDGAAVVRRPLHPSHVTLMGGVPVTTLARTAVDVALSFPSPQALVTVDAVVRRGVTRGELREILRSTGSGRGVRQARRTIEWADGHAESALESRGRGEMLVRGVPRPMCNVSIRLDAVEFRVDDWWNDFAVAGEADGAGKYDAEGRGADRVLWQEKLRQDWLVEHLDIPVVRYVDQEVRFDADGLVDRVNRKLRLRSDRPWRPPPGVAVFQRPIPGVGGEIRWLLGGPGSSM
jgi:hypothetical protein